MPRKRNTHGRKKFVYWWDEEIAAPRKRWFWLRRMMTKIRRRNGDKVVVQSEDFRNAKMKLNKAIYKSKKPKWEELKRDDNNDPCRLRYGIIMRNLRKGTSCPALKSNRILWTLFSNSF